MPAPQVPLVLQAWTRIQDAGALAKRSPSWTVIPDTFWVVEDVDALVLIFTMMMGGDKLAPTSSHLELGASMAII